MFVLCGIFILARKKFNFEDWQYSFLALALLSFWMGFFKTSPYRLLFLLPGFNGVRAAYFWMPYFALGLAVLSSMLMTYFFRKKSPVVTWSIIIFSVLVFIYSSVGENKNYAYFRRFKGTEQRFPTSSTIYDYLKTLPNGAVLNLPVSGDRIRDSMIESVRMMYQLSHKKPMVTGYATFTPPLIKKIYRSLLTDGISDEFVEKAAITGVRYVVVDFINGNSEEICNKCRKLSRVKILYDQTDGMIVELPKVKAEKDISKLLKIW